MLRFYTIVWTVDSPWRFPFRGGLFATFCEKMGDPQKAIVHCEGVDHFSRKAGKKDPLVSV